MSSYKYTRTTGNLTIRQSSNQSKVFVWIREGGHNAAIHVDKGDAPTVAAELLKAAGQESIIVPKSTHEVVAASLGAVSCGLGNEMVMAYLRQSPSTLRAQAANYIAIAEYVESKAQREADAEKKLQERRNALVRKFGGGGGSYAATDFPLQQAVDAYIELEDGKAK